MTDPIRPTKFAHVVYRTRRFDAMVNWYQTVFGATIQYRNPALAFLTYDDEHHRVALLNRTSPKTRSASCTAPMRCWCDCAAASPKSTCYRARHTSR